ncbi:hypothetical protein LSTR_LSTR002998 [Laodelphax striatellus]|uniref:Uncharacterized protein n=1 Tax=Laodelphax striatellus TaxID=195883 RepID=A0A482WT12_LAOST|nr:hypothetical protein LSTR_LSTR002998 [Laodelphax striatellus]
MNANVAGLQSLDNLSLEEIEEQEADQIQIAKDLQYEVERLNMEVECHTKDLHSLREYNAQKAALSSPIVIEQLESEANEKAKIVEMKNELAELFPHQLEKYRVDRIKEMSCFTEDVDELCNLFLNAPNNYESVALSNKLHEVVKMQKSIKMELNGIASDLAAMKEKFSLDLPIRTSKITDLRNTLAEVEKKKEKHYSMGEKLKQEEEAINKILGSLKQEIMQLKNHQN